MVRSSEDPDLIDADVFHKELEAQARAITMDGSIGEDIEVIKELDENQFANTGFKVSDFAAQQVRENPRLRQLFQEGADAGNMLDAKILQAAKEFRYPRRESL